MSTSRWFRLFWRAWRKHSRNSAQLSTLRCSRAGKDTFHICRLGWATSSGYGCMVAKASGKSCLRLCPVPRPVCLSSACNSCRNSRAVWTSNFGMPCRMPLSWFSKGASKSSFLFFCFIPLSQTTANEHPVKLTLELIANTYKLRFVSSKEHVFFHMAFRGQCVYRSTTQTTRLPAF